MNANNVGAGQRIPGRVRRHERRSLRGVGQFERVGCLLQTHQRQLPENSAALSKRGVRMRGRAVPPGYSGHGGGHRLVRRAPHSHLTTYGGCALSYHDGTNRDDLAEQIIIRRCMISFATA